MTRRTRAAVLVPLDAGSPGPAVTLTRRTDLVPHHRGQIAFPGGRFEATCDESLLATALREAEEEIGLSPAAVDLLGALPDVETVSSRFVISPFVGRVPADYPFRLRAGEVAEVFRMPLSALDDPSLRREIEWLHQGASRRVPAIDYEGRVIWGATLRILGLLLESSLVPFTGR